MLLETRGKDIISDCIESEIDIRSDGFCQDKCRYYLFKISESQNLNGIDRFFVHELSSRTQMAHAKSRSARQKAKKT